jgi:hypothetical protein
MPNRDWNTRILDSNIVRRAFFVTGGGDYSRIKKDIDGISVRRVLLAKKWVVTRGRIGAFKKGGVTNEFVSPTFGDPASALINTWSDFTSVSLREKKQCVAHIHLVFGGGDTANRLFNVNRPIKAKKGTFRSIRAVREPGSCVKPAPICYPLGVGDAGSIGGTNKKREGQMKNIFIGFACIGTGRNVWRLL